jgi:hypothetical protein
LFFATAAAENLSLFFLPILQGTHHYQSNSKILPCVTKKKEGEEQQLHLLRRITVVLPGELCTFL